jgi:hypothetical protein
MSMPKAPLASCGNKILILSYIDAGKVLENVGMCKELHIY